MDRFNVKYGAKVKLIFQIAKIGVGCLHIHEKTIIDDDNVFILNPNLNTYGVFKISINNFVEISNSSAVYE